MIDINFYMKVFDLKKALQEGQKYEKGHLAQKLEQFRSKDPVVYNIETTNACNMTCQMCPRTTLMTRPAKTMGMELFNKISEQLRPFTEEEWQNWENFVQNNYHISPNDMSENHFFLYVIPKVIVLHGYGDPLLDQWMPQRIKTLSEKKIPTYFSCNPANIDIPKTIEMFKNGLGYIKYSVESIDDSRHKAIRGAASNFTASYKNILKLLELKKKNGYKTEIIITMLNLNKPQQQQEFEELKEKFRGNNVYIYLKSKDQQWYGEDQQQTKSLHWLEFCQFPWSSMTIKSNGEAAECVEDFNNEIVLGNTQTETLYHIWNGEKYRRFRENHFNLTPGIKCTEQCDMKLIGQCCEK